MAGSFVASAYPQLTQIPVGIFKYDGGCGHSSQAFSYPGFLQKKHEPGFRIPNADLLRGTIAARRFETCLLSSNLGCRHLKLKKFRANAVGDVPDPSKDEFGEDEGAGRLKRQLDDGKKISTDASSSDEEDLERWSGEERNPGNNQDSAKTSGDPRGSFEAVASEGSVLEESEDAQTQRVLDILHKREGAPSESPARSLRERFGGFRVSGPQVPMTLQPQNPIKPRKQAAAEVEEKPETSTKEGLDTEESLVAEESAVAKGSVVAEESVKPTQEAEESAGSSGDWTPETEDRLDVEAVPENSAPEGSTSTIVGSGEAESSDPVGSSDGDSAEAVGSIESALSKVEADLPEEETDVSEEGTVHDSEGVEETTGERYEEKAVEGALPDVPTEDIPIPPTTPEDERLRAAFEETLLSDWKVEGLEGELQLYVTKIKALEEFEKELARPDDDIDLVRTSALIAQHAYPECTPEDCESQLRFLAEELKESLPPPSERYPLRMIKAINKFLYEKEGFKGSWGSDRDMYSPKLLCLNKVLANKSGMPILMSVVYLELARRVGFPMVGVNLPLHFVIRPMATDCEFLVDAHDGGKLMFLEDVQEKLASVVKAKVVVNPDFISNTPAVPKRTILLRILNNLKRKYFTNRNYSECLAIIEYMKRVQPPTEEPGLYRDEGLCLFALRRTKEATESIDAYLTIWNRNLTPNQEWSPQLNRGSRYRRVAPTHSCSKQPLRELPSPCPSCT